MLIKNIVAGVNHKLSGEMLSFRELIPHLDSVIDDINQQLNTSFLRFQNSPIILSPTIASLIDIFAAV